MHDWMDFNRDGEVDWSEKVLAGALYGRDHADGAQDPP